MSAAVVIVVGALSVKSYISTKTYGGYSSVRF